MYRDAGCSVVDYVLCMPEMMPNFTQFSISDPSIESDHCKIEFSIKTENRNAELNINSENEPRNLPQIDHTFIWDENKRLFFINNLESEEITHELHNLTSNIDTITQSSEIDNNLEAFCNLLNKTCSPFKKKTSKTEINQQKHRIVGMTVNVNKNRQIFTKPSIITDLIIVTKTGKIWYKSGHNTNHS